MTKQLDGIVPGMREAMDKAAHCAEWHGFPKATGLLCPSCDGEAAEEWKEETFPHAHHGILTAFVPVIVCKECGGFTDWRGEGIRACVVNAADLIANRHK